MSVVICAYSDERRDQLRAALRSVLEQTTPPVEVIAVVDHNPGLLEKIAAEFPEVTTIQNEGSRGASAARNTGVRRAKGDIVAFLDDDAVAAPDWLARMLPHYDEPDVVAVGGAAVPEWPSDRPKWFPREFDWVVGCTFLGQPEQVASVRNLWGCNMSMRREVFEELGGFSVRMTRESNGATVCEEAELCIRARQLYPQSKIISDPAIVVRHFVAPARTRWRYFRLRCVTEGRSKAAVVAEVGANDGLADERSYTTRTLPAGIVRGMGDAILHFDFWGAARAGAIIIGLACAAWGYLDARWTKRWKVSSVRSSFLPIKIVDLDVTRPLPRIEARDPATGRAYGGVFCLVRRDRTPLRILELPRQQADLSPTQLKALLAEDRLAASSPRRSAPAPLSDPPHLSVIVATRDRAASLAACLDSLLAQDYRKFDITVVDSAPSSSETAEMLASRYLPTERVRYMVEGRPGLGHAHRRAMEGVVSPILAFTDDDVIVDRRWLSALAADFEGGQHVGCVTGLILPAELETRAQFWTERHGAFGKGFQRKVYDLAENRPTGPLFPFTAGQFGSGANMAFLTEALRRIGGFDSALGAGTVARSGDDLAAFFGVVRAGYQLVYEPEAIIWHHHRRNEGGMRRQAFSYGVGLGAYLTKAVLEEPSLALDLAKALPAGLAHMWGASSPRMQRLPDDYPGGLIWLERLGVLAGPLAYLRSRALLRRSASAREVEPVAAAVETRESEAS